jgi:hypothetical protein
VTKEIITTNIRIKDHARDRIHWYEKKVAFHGIYETCSALTVIKKKETKKQPAADTT